MINCELCAQTHKSVCKTQNLGSLAHKVRPIITLLELHNFSAVSTCYALLITVTSHSEKKCNHTNQKGFCK